MGACGVRFSKIQYIIFWYLSHLRAANAKTNLQALTARVHNKCKWRRAHLKLDFLPLEVVKFKK